jgi:gluconate 2-dehydrogenase gamma chain
MRETSLKRRVLLMCGASIATLIATRASSATYGGVLPWSSNADTLPEISQQAGWLFFNAAESVAVGALVDRLIPSDDLSIGGKEANVAVYIDRQLAGNFGNDTGLYMQAPFADGLPGQGPQSPLTPAARYRKSLAALDSYCRSAYLGKVFADIPAIEQDKLIGMLESGTLPLNGLNSKAFFLLLWQNTKEGFLADPIYGGNRDMAGWRMIGFPGARYDYRDWIDKHNQPYPLAPVGIMDHPNWSRPA